MGDGYELYGYNALGQLVRVSAAEHEAEYSYNPDGLRHKKVVDGDVVGLVGSGNGDEIVTVPAAQAAYVSDMAWAGETNVYAAHPAKRDRSTNENNPIRLNGQEYEKGVGVHAGTTITVQLGGKYDRFVCDVGMDDSVIVYNGEGIFIVTGDGAELYNSGVVRAGEQRRSVDISVAGVQVLELTLALNGENYWGAHGDWAGARLYATVVRSGGTRSYDYDAFGNELDEDGTPKRDAGLVSEIGVFKPLEDNPFRYCGEYFDDETGSVYLRARYYSPGIGRFVSEDKHWNSRNNTYGDDPTGLNEYTLFPDRYAILQSGNLYAYCINNPMMFADPTGEVLFWIIVGAVVGAIVSGVVETAHQVTRGAAWNDLNWVNIGLAMASGAVSGALGGSAANIWWQMAGNAVISGITSIVTDVVYGKDINIGAFLTSVGIGALVGSVGGNGLQYGLESVGYRIVNASGKYFSTITIKYINTQVLRDLEKEFAKGIVKGGAIEIAVLFGEDFIQITYETPSDQIGRGSGGGGGGAKRCLY